MKGIALQASAYTEIETIYKTYDQIRTDAFAYLTKCGHNPCKNQSNRASTNGTITACRVTLKAMLKDFQFQNRLTVTGTLDKNIKKLMKTGRCRTEDKPSSSTNLRRWAKTSFTWRLRNEKIPSFGLTKTREIFRQSFEDWAAHAPLTFKEVSENEEADFDLAFADANNDEHLDGPGGLLGYAAWPPEGKIRFDAMEQWSEKYNIIGTVNLRLMATHNIGHALGLEHSNEPSSIMYFSYRPRQSEDILSEGDRSRIQALYGTRLPSDNGVLHLSDKYLNSEKERVLTKRSIYEMKHGQNTKPWINDEKYVHDQVNNQMAGEGTYGEVTADQ